MLKIDFVFSGQRIKRGVDLQGVRYKAVKESIFIGYASDQTMIIYQWLPGYSKLLLSKPAYKLQQSAISQKSFDHLHNKGQQQAENNHGSDWKIEPEIFFLYTYIARQAANPVEFIVKKINDHAGKHDKNANDNDPFSGIAVHDAKIKL